MQKVDPPLYTPESSIGMSLRPSTRMIDTSPSHSCPLLGSLPLALAREARLAIWEGQASCLKYGLACQGAEKQYSKANFQEWKQLILTASNNTFNPTVNNNNE